MRKRKATEGLQASEPRSRERSNAATARIERGADNPQGEVLAAAQQLREVGSIRVQERLAREARAEHEFQDWYKAHPEAVWIWNLAMLDPRGLSKEQVKQALVLQQAQASAYASLEELAREKGPELLESPSFRDALALITARRRDRYKSQGNWPERIAAALFGKRREGGRPVDLHEECLDDARRECADELHELLRRADGETPPRLVREQEIRQHLSERSFVTYPPETAAVPPGWKEEKRLRQLARHLSAYRRGGRGSLDYKARAVDWMIECWGLEGRDAERERERLRGKKRRSLTSSRT